MKLRLPVALLVTAALLPAVRAAEFPEPPNTEQLDLPFTTPDVALSKLQLPDGFRATVFAAEPDVRNPIAMAWDARGRLWIAENYTYSERTIRWDLKLRDRILIFEDADGDGRFDQRTVFADDLQMLTSIEVGLGGVWAIALPNVLFIPDRNGDDRPDGPAEVVVDGFRGPQENHHNIANGLRFGPDGWLYGRCGASGAADIKIAGAPESDRIPVRGGMWRYHPVRRVVETVTCGNTNPWGHDWNEVGELFYINTVNGHLWHAFAGAHFKRAHTLDPNPRTYELIDQHADHWHFDTSQDWSKSRDGAANAYGGGHSHIGAMIYLGDNWPDRYRGRLFTLNQHGRRANMDVLERAGSGYVARHGQDAFLAADPWFRGLDLGYGPDGGVFVLDWSDIGECHDHTGVHRGSGRIYKITYGQPARPAIGDVSKLSSRELVNLHRHRNEWFVQQARLELTARARTGRGLEAAKEQLPKMVAGERDPVVRLRALWTAYTIGAADEQWLRSLLRDGNEHVRAWAVRLLADAWPMDSLVSQRPAGSEKVAPAPATLKEFIRMAREDPSALVRLALASTLQRLPVKDRPALARGLVARAADATDHNLPLLIWYGLIPVADTQPDALAELANACELPTTRRLIARRLTEDIETNTTPLGRVLAQLPGRPEAFQTDVLAGLAEALTGWRKAPQPPGWAVVAKTLGQSPNTAIRDRVRELSVVFGDGRALDDVKRLALDKDADLAARKSALQTLIDSRPDDLRAICEQLITVRFLNPIAARGLAQFGDAKAADALVKAYRQFHQTERPQLLATIVSRPVFAHALLDAVESGKIPRSDLSPFHARQMRGLNDPELTARVTAVWGEVREAAEDKRRLIAELRRELTPAALAAADKSQGRALYNVACASCHRLYGVGGEIGPDLTGAGRDNLDYLLDNIVDPSAVVSADFRMSVVELKDGRVLNGLLKVTGPRTLALQTMTEVLNLDRADVKEITTSALSLMPEGLLDGLTAGQRRDLIAYLMHPGQVPLPEGASASR
jgi:putative membrane-bound dehydrogenase-like protein